MTRLREAAAALLRVLMEAARADNVQAVTLLTLLLVLLHGGVFWYYTAPLTILAAIGLLVPRMRTAPDSVVTRLPCRRQYLQLVRGGQPQVPDDLRVPGDLLQHARPNRTGCSCSRGKSSCLCFLFAVVWKLMAPDYLDGSFFRQIMLTDQRFESRQYATGADGHQLA